MTGEFADLFRGPKGRAFLTRVAQECAVIAPQDALDRAGRTDPYELAEQKARREVGLLIFELAGASLEVRLAPEDGAPRQAEAQTS